MKGKYCVWYCEMYQRFVWDFDSGTTSWMHKDCCQLVNKTDTEELAGNYARYLNKVYLNIIDY